MLKWGLIILGIVTVTFLAGGYLLPTAITVPIRMEQCKSALRRLETAEKQLMTPLRTGQMPLDYYRARADSNLELQGMLGRLDDRIRDIRLEIDLSCY